MLVKKEHAAVGKHHLAHPPPPCAADQAGGGDRMVGGAEGAAADQLTIFQAAGDALDAGHLDRLRTGERWQDRRQSLCQHRLAGARGAAQQQVVLARGGQDQRLDGLWLAAHVAEVPMPRPAAPARRLAKTLGLFIPRAGRRQRIAGPAVQHARGAGETLGDRHVKALHQRRLARPRAREHERPQTLLLRSLRDREGAVTGAHLAVERELAEQRMALQALGGQLIGGRQQRAREREIQAGANLGDVAGGRGWR